MKKRLIALVLALGLVTAGIAYAQGPGYGYGGGYGGMGPGYGGMGPGMMGYYGGNGYGGMGPGMMGGYGAMGPGMMGGYGWQGVHPVDYSSVMQLLDKTAKTAKIDKAKNQVSFAGDQIEIAVASEQPGFPDTTFEVAGLVNPTIVVPAGALVTLDLVNMDYGNLMNHGLVITPVPPPYPVLSMMGMPYTLVGIPVMPPRQLKDADKSLYMEGTVTFRAPSAGTYYYVCQFYDHAYKGMYGRFVVTQG